MVRPEIWVQPVTPAPPVSLERAERSETLVQLDRQGQRDRLAFQEHLDMPADLDRREYPVRRERRVRLERLAIRDRRGRRVQQVAADCRAGLEPLDQTDLKETPEVQAGPAIRVSSATPA